MFDAVHLTSNACFTGEISAYIDGELSPACELELEAHLAVCESCVHELNRQKEFLCSLNSSLKVGGEIDLPPDFAKHIAANAESTVTGLRRPGERFNAIFICVGLFLFVLFALGTDATISLAGLNSALDQATAVGGFFGHLIYSFFVGVAIVLRTLGSQIGFYEITTIVLTGFAVFALMLLSRKILRLRRA